MESHIFGRSAAAILPTAASGEGCYLIDTAGKRYFDGSGGAAVSCLGHGHAKICAALHGQLDQLAYAHTSFFTSEPAEKLADKLIEHAPTGIEKVYLVSSGSEAVEAALKLARQYFTETDQPSRHRIIARRQSYHGNTLGALASGGNAWRRKQFSPLLIETTHIAPCYEYRERGDDETAFDYGQRVANELETEINRLGANSVMAFIAEPVVGATAGAVLPVAGYFKRLREICTQYGILLILDEVMCGMGRTGSLFACEQDGISPDIVTIAKGLGAGYQPIGAMLCSGTVFAAIRDGSGFFQHGHTYLGHPMAAAGSLAVLETLIDDGLLQQVPVQGDKLHTALSAALGNHQNVGDIRGRGLFWGIELVQDRPNKTPFDPARAVHKQIKATAFEQGLLCYPMGGTLDGRRGDHILLAPPFIITDQEIEHLVRLVRGTIETVLPK